MLVVSPRSYVTAAFDQLFPSLLEYVYDKLSPINNWWVDVVCINKYDIFIHDDIISQITEDNEPEHYAELFDYFDELSLCRLVKFKAQNYFYESELKHFRRLHKIRNQWAHRGYKRSELYYDDEAPKKEWAELSIRYMKEVANFLKEYDDEAEKRISILLFKMKCDWLDDNTELPPHTMLIDWLYDKVVSHVTAPDSPLDDVFKERVYKSFENLKEYTDKATSEKSASRYVVDYYWNAIRVKTDVHDEIKNQKKGIPTFEDVVEGFTKYCYGI